MAAKSGLAAAVAYNIRYYPLCLEARDRIGRGAAGNVLHAQGSYVQDWLLHKTDFNWRVLAAEGGELRALADIGTHWLDLVQFITGLKIVAVCADLASVHSTRHAPRGSVQTFSGKQDDQVAAKSLDSDAVPIDTEDAGGVLLEFENGARGTLWVSQVTPKPQEFACSSKSTCQQNRWPGTANAPTNCGWESETNQMNCCCEIRPC